MNNLLIATILFLSGSITSMSNVTKVSLIKSELFEVTLGSELIKEKFVSAKYDIEEKKLSFVTIHNMHSILIFNEEELEMVLPVMADRVSLGESMFVSGNYKLGFNFKDEPEITYADMVMK